MAQYEHTDDSVTVVIGSGAGGGTLANELCQKGLKVVCLEAGRSESLDTYVNDEWAAFDQLSWLDNRTASGSWRIAKDFPNLPAWTCKTVGGTTVHWAGASLRIQEHEFKAKTRYSGIRGTSLLDWPLTLSDLEPYYARAEDKMGVTRTNGIPGLPGNNNFKVMYNGATRLGYTVVHTGRMAINSQSRDDRGACRQLGFCFQGCKVGAKWSTAYTEIPAAEATGRLDLRPQCQVLQIQHDRQGNATGVLYADQDGSQVVQHARVVCVACNAIETARLLLNSHSSAFPQGLANSSGQVGRNYMRHLTGSVYATFGEPVHMDRGTVMAGIIEDEAGHNSERGVRRGFRNGDGLAPHALLGIVSEPGGLGEGLHSGSRPVRQHGWYVDRRRGHAAGNERGDPPRHGKRPIRPANPQRPLRRSSQRRRDARIRLPTGGCGVRRRRGDQDNRGAALSLYPQPGNLSYERRPQ